MDVIYILDRDFNLIGVIDEYISTIWRPSYSDVGDFEIYLGATDKAVALLNKNNYVLRSSDITVDESGNVTYKKVMIIKNVTISTDVEIGDYLTVTGRELKYLLHQRIVWTQTTLTGTVENAMRRLVTENAINPVNPNRVIPNLILGDSVGYTDTIDKQVTGDALDKAIVDICTAYDYGWDIYIYNNNLVLTVYKGIDRSYEQTDRPYVVFSDEFENLYNTEYQLYSEQYANTTLVGGEGEGVNRITRAVGDGYSGLDRYETYTDARDISQNKGTENEIDINTYNTLLDQRGLENLATLKYVEGFTGEVLSDVAFKYLEDFYLGDLVSVINKYGISKTVRVISAIESEDENGKKLLPQFNNEF